jgi:hypothetical protein
VRGRDFVHGLAGERAAEALMSPVAGQTGNMSMPAAWGGGRRP